jgi:NADH-quinone oxidoreductase subunit E
VAGPGVGEPSVAGLLVAEAAGWTAEQPPAPLVAATAPAAQAAAPASASAPASATTERKGS